jgi:vacuolar iron transporter family protein
MAEKRIDKSLKRKILGFQKNEISEHTIYKKLSDSVKDRHNKKVLNDISKDELRHYGLLKRYTNENVKPSRLMVWKFYLISRILGITFGIKLMERGEENAQESYNEISRHVPEARMIEKDENEHEKELIGIINEERLNYVGSWSSGSTMPSWS